MQVHVYDIISVKAAMVQTLLLLALMCGLEGMHAPPFIHQNVMWILGIADSQLYLQHVPARAAHIIIVCWLLDPPFYSSWFPLL